MAVEVRVASVAVSTSTGNQNLTVGGWSSVPDAVILFLARTTGGTADHRGICIGAATSSSERWHFGNFAEDNLASTETQRWENTDSILRMIDTNATQEAKADFVEFIAGGCTINWSDAPPSAYIVKAVFFAGLENATAGKFDAVAVSTDTTITTGHDNHIVFLGSAQIPIGTDIPVHNGFSWGVCSNDTGITEMCHEVFCRHGQPNAPSGGRILADACGMANNGIPGSILKYEITLDAFTGTGFDANFEGGASDISDDWLYLALELPSGISSKVISFGSPTSTGNDDVTGVGFKPQALIAGLTHFTLFDTGFDTSPQADHSGYGVWTENDEECVSCYNDDGAATSDVKTDEASIAIDLVGTSGTELAASFVSMDSDGFTLDWSEIYTSICYQWALAIEEDGVEVSDNQIAYLNGQDSAVDNQKAYLAGGLEVSDNQAAFLAGGIEVVEIRAVRQAVNTSTGVQDFDVSGWTVTPQAAFYIITRAIADNTPTDHGIIGLGLATSTSERHTGIAADRDDTGGISPNECTRWAMSDECIAILDASRNIDGEADLSEFHAGGSEINWGNAPSSAYLLTALYFSGFNEVDLQKVDMSASSPQIVTVGFEADVVLLISTNCGDTDSLLANSELGMGVAVNGSGQGHLVGFGADGETDGESSRGIATGYFWGGASDTDWAYGMQIGSFTSTGFSLTRTGAADTSDDWFILSLKLPTGVSAWVGGIASPTSTGDDAQTGPSFRPQALIGLISNIQTFNAWEEDSAPAGAWAVTVATASEQFCHAVADENGVDPTNTQSLVDNTLIHLTDDDGTDQLIASLASFDVNGWTPNYSTVDTNALQQIWLAIEEDGEVSDKQVAYLSGQDSAVDNQPAYLNGGVEVSDNQIAFLNGQDSAVDNQPAYLNGGLEVTGNQIAYLNGQDSAVDNQVAFLKGSDSAVDNQIAFLAGGIEVVDKQESYLKGKDSAVDNQIAYLNGGVEVVDNQIAYLKGSDSAVDNQPAYLNGGIVVSDNQIAYLNGGVEVVDNQEAYLAGKIEVSDNQVAYLNGQDSAVDNQIAYLKGQTTILDNQPAFLEGTVDSRTPKMLLVRSNQIPIRQLNI